MAQMGNAVQSLLPKLDSRSSGMALAQQCCQSYAAGAALHEEDDRYHCCQRQSGTMLPLVKGTALPPPFAPHAFEHLGVAVAVALDPACRPPGQDARTYERD